MTREQVWAHVTDILRADFGRLLDVRDVLRVRRVAGDAWTVTVVIVAPSGDLHLADVTVDDAGVMTPKLTADDVVEAARLAKRFSLNAPPPDELAGFGDANPEDELEDALGGLEEMEEPIEDRVKAALAKADPASLRIARDLLPRMLADHEKRGSTLFAMAAVELKLGEKEIAKPYLEAAAREFADRFDLPSLEKAAAAELALVGSAAFGNDPIHLLLEQSRARLKPLDQLFDARSFRGLDASVHNLLHASAELRTLAPEETLVTEGEPSRNVFIVKSGLVGVWLEKPAGGSWLVRSCFPGWLLGESSVLAENARCTASLRAERVSEVWILPAKAVKDAIEHDPELGRRIAETKQVHRIDSFFSMHETMGGLDVQVRDDLLSCIQRLETFTTETVLLPANEIPQMACLVAKGSIGLYEGGKTTPAGEIPEDSFYGVRDAIHEIAPSVAAIARPGTTVAFFDATLVRKLCARSPEHVVAVLERLG